MARASVYAMAVVPCVVVLLLSSSGASAAPSTAGPARLSSAHQVIVEYSPGTSRTQMAAIASADSAGTTEITLERIRPARSGRGISFAVYSSRSLSEAELVARFRGRPGVKQVSLNSVMSIAVTPNDPSYPQLWGMENTGQVDGVLDADIDASDAWDLTAGDGAVVVSLDTGVDYRHPDLQANIWCNPGEIAGDGIDNDQNGYTDDVHGIDTYAIDSDPMDENGHGTHTAGIIAAVGNNGVGVIGVAWQTKLMPLRFLGPNGTGYDADAIECINYAIDMKLNHGVNIVAINMSFVGDTYSSVLHDAVQAAGNAGVVVCAAAGNNTRNIDVVPVYPASFDCPNMIAVGASTPYDRALSFSNYGATRVDLFAPGQNILSTYTGPNSGSGSPGAYTWLSGTSMATPHVTGAVALVAALWPSDSVDTRIARVLSTVDPVPSLAHRCATGGRLNAGTATNAGSGGIAVTGLQPSSGPAAGGTSVVIGGRGFTGATAVSFGGEPAYDFDVDSSTRIIATSPPHSEGTVDVIVTSPQGSSTPSPAGRFNYTATAATRYDHTHVCILKNGGWTDFKTPSASGGSYGRASSSLASATIYFTGTRLDWIGMKGLTTGKADVYLDGVKVTPVPIDLSAGAPSYQVNVWSTGELPSGPHRVKIERSSSSAIGKYVTLDAVDIWGTIDAPSVTKTRYDHADVHIVKSGGWTDFKTPSASGGSYGRASTSLASTTIYFTGTRLDWIGMKGLTTGKADVYVDGVKVTRMPIDLRAATAMYQVTVWSTGTLPFGPHRVKIERSSSSAIGKYVTLDAVDIWGAIDAPPVRKTRYQQTHSLIAKTGTWNSFFTAKASAGSYGRSSTSNASATIKFIGTRLDYVGMKGTTTGYAEIWVDGVKVSGSNPINLYSAIPTYQVNIYSTGTLTFGLHTVKIVRASASATGKYLTLDAFDVWGWVR